MGKPFQHEFLIQLQNSIQIMFQNSNGKWLELCLEHNIRIRDGLELAIPICVTKDVQKMTTRKCMPKRDTIWNEFGTSLINYAKNHSKLLVLLRRNVFQPVRQPVSNFC